MLETLAAVIRAEISARGPMTFRRFMELALYHEAFGYYASGRARIGRGGDFFTNVSVGPLFGRLLARQFAEMWGILGAPGNFTIVEQGAHRGDLAADVLGGLQGMFPDCFEAARYLIVEPFEKLAAWQRERLGNFGEKVQWARTIAEVRTEAGVHFSNELLDAFPVHLVTWTGDEWRERMVGFSGDSFAFTDGPRTSGELGDACRRMPGPLPPGYVTEVNPSLRNWTAEIAASIQRGFVLAIDYGFSREEYCAPWRSSGTLSAYAAHRREPDPLARPGELDLTAHVEFDSLIDAATSAGFRTAGFTDQHHFMVGMGALHFADGANSTERRAFQTLMHPEMMGRAFKAIAFSKGIDSIPALAGFRFARTPQEK